MLSRILLLLFAFTISFNSYAQKDDPVLFSVEGVPVHKSEFEYIYTKTNGTNADFSKATLDEYLNLYVNFKLKVQKAKEMKLDTIVSLQQELNGYRRQLADSYLIDREVTEKLVKEAFDRTQQDVDISHILIKLAPNATPADTLKSLERAMEAKKMLDNGKPFDNVAQIYSEDKSAAKNKGHIGWVTALFPNGFYALETAAYNAEVGSIVGPIRTSAGYHVIKINERRPARGEAEVAHILVRLDKQPDSIKARQRIDEAYKKLKEGADFNEIAKEYSDDNITANKGGYLGYFGINRYEKAFEDAAFGLENDGDYSKPIQTSIGWHIIKRINLKQGQPLQMVKSALQNKIKGDPRFELAKESMVQRIKKEGNFQEDRTTLNNFIASLQADTSNAFLTYKWKAPANPSKVTLFSFGKNELNVTLGDFERHLQGASRTRQQMARQGIEAVVEQLYNEFISENALKYEEKQLESKYPEFKSLMREYEEGVLLFEVTKMEVWDKASQDTIGLQAFYDNNKDKYNWDDRAVVSEFSLVENSKDKINIIRDFSKTHQPEDVLKSFNGNGPEQILSFKSKTYEKGRNDILDKMKWESGELSPIEINKKNKSYEFFKIEEIIPPSPKTLKDARGYVVADYQDYLEQEWLKNLKNEYKVEINQKVFNKMVKR